jgi:hypothetical protein
MTSVGQHVYSPNYIPVPISGISSDTGKYEVLLLIDSYGYLFKNLKHASLRKENIFNLTQLPQKKPICPLSVVTNIFKKL